MVTRSRIVSPQTSPTVPSALLARSVLSLSLFANLPPPLLSSSSHSSPIQPLLLPTSFSLSVVADLTREVCLYAREFPLFVIFVFFPLLLTRGLASLLCETRPLPPKPFQRYSFGARIRSPIPPSSSYIVSVCVIRIFARLQLYRPSKTSSEILSRACSQHKTHAPSLSFVLRSTWFD